MINYKNILIGISCLLILVTGCAASGHGGGSRDFSSMERHFVDEYVEVMGHGFFDPKPYWEQENKRRELVLQLKGNDDNFNNARRMNYMMTRQIERDRGSFFCLLFYINPGIKVRVEQEAFTIRIAHGDSIAEYRDQGLCAEISFAAFDKNKPAYMDSRDRAFYLHNGLMPERIKGYPLVTYARFPPEAATGKFVGLSIDYEHWKYEGPGVKEKPKWK